MLDDGALKKQRVAILNKYTDHYQLPLVRDKKKLEKLRAINEDESYDDVAFNKLENQVMHHIFGLFIWLIGHPIVRLDGLLVDYWWGVWWVSQMKSPKMHHSILWFH